MRYIQSKFILLTVILFFPINSFSLSFSFISYSTIEGNIYDSIGNPIRDVEVKAVKDNISYWFNNNKFPFRTFSDSLGYFKLNLILIDSDLDGLNNIDPNQRDICEKYCNEAASNFHNFLGKESVNSIRLDQNIYKRRTCISFSRLGYSDFILDEWINCRMDSVSLPNNLFKHVIINRNTNYSTLSHINSKEYYELRIEYGGAFIINGRSFSLNSKFDNIDSLINPKYRLDVKEIMSKIYKSKKYDDASIIISSCGIYGGLLGLLVFHNKYNYYYPICSGVAILSVGLTMNLTNNNNRKKSINKYNDNLLNKMQANGN